MSDPYEEKSGKKEGARFPEAEREFLLDVCKRRVMSKTSLFRSSPAAIDLIHIIFEMLDEFVSNIPREAVSRDTSGDVGPRIKKFNQSVARSATTGHK